MKDFRVVYRRAYSRGCFLSRVIGCSRLVGGRWVRIPRVLLLPILRFRLKFAMFGVVMKRVSCGATYGEERLFRCQNFVFPSSFSRDVAKVYSLPCNFLYFSLDVNYPSLRYSIYANGLRKQFVPRGEVPTPRFYLTNAFRRMAVTTNFSRGTRGLCQYVSIYVGFSTREGAAVFVYLYGLPSNFWY